jgi:nucleotide-binding universal stress UspA family protein
MKKRILVALDNSTHSVAALEAAARLAASLSAELIGLFVEDVNLLRLAGLPMTEAIDATSAAVRPLDSHQMADDLRLQAAQARRALVRVAEPLQIAYSFKVARGQVTPELLTAALEADLLTLGRGSRALGRRRMGSTARAVAAACDRPTLFMTPAAKKAGGGQPVMVTFDGSEAAVTALEMGVQLAQALATRLTILLLAETPTAAYPLQERVEKSLQRLDDHNLALSYQLLPRAEASALAHLAQKAGGCILVLGGQLAQNADGLQLLLDQLDCPVMIARPQPDN